MAKYRNNIVSGYLYSVLFTCTAPFRKFSKVPNNTNIPLTTNTTANSTNTTDDNKKNHTIVNFLKGAKY